mgnify:CR=1 FL=1
MVGVAYKKDVDDPRESPAFAIIEALEELGAEVSYHDPHVPELKEAGLSNSPDIGSALAEAELSVIVTAHPEFDWEEIIARSPLVFDLRGVTRGFEDSGNVTRL